MLCMKLLTLTSAAVVLLALSGCAQQQQLSEHRSATGDTAGAADASNESFLKFKTASSTPKAKAVTPKKKTEKNQATDSNDIWASVTSELAFANDVPERKIAPQLEWLDGNQKYFDNTMGRANLYLPYVLDQVLEAGLPSEVALLPFVESAYNPYAYSPSGAAGLWQFIPSTGSLYGLEQNRWYEGRRDIVESTDAAIRYIQALNAQFNGDWLLTFAAYNGGPGTVQRAIEANRRRGLDTDFWSLDLSPETRRYVPRLIALSKVITQPEKYDIERMSIDAKPNIDIVALEKPIDLAQAAKLAGIGTEEIYQLNPGYSRWVTPPNGSYHLVLPTDKSADFITQLASLPEKQWRAGSEYVIQKGDTLGKIARNLGVSVQDLALVNNLRPSSVLHIGQTLRTPSGASGGNQAEPSFAPKALTAYTVKPGDNLWSIAKAHKLDTKDILVWNKLNNKSVIKPGQTLRFYQAKERATAGNNYKVRQGDSLYNIAKRFNVEVKDLLAWNDLGSNAMIRPGQDLKILSAN